MLAKLGRAITGKRNDSDDPVFSINYYSPTLTRAGAKPPAMSSQPNLTVFHSNSVKDKDYESDDDDDYDNDNPPPSPSKRSFKTFFKRSSRLAFDMHHPSEATSRMSLPLPKKKRGAVQADTFEPPTNNSKDITKSIIVPQQNTVAVSCDSKQSIRSILRTPGDNTSNHTRNTSSASKGQAQSVRFFSRDAYRDEEEPETRAKSPSLLAHSRSTSSLHSPMDRVDEEFGKTPRSKRFSLSRTDTVSLLDKLRNEGKVESPSNTLTFAAQQGKEDMMNGADPFSGEKDAPSLIPFPGDDVPRHSLESSRSSIKTSSIRSHRVNNSQDSIHQTASHSFEIPTGMTNLLDSYPGEPEEPLLPQISMSEGLFAELREEMSDAAWMPNRTPEEEQVLEEDNFLSGVGTNASNAATLRQRSFTLPANPMTANIEEAYPVFHASLAQSSPAMSRILREENIYTVPQNCGRSSVEPRTPARAISNMTQFFTPQTTPPKSALAINSAFSPMDHRRASSFPDASSNKDGDQRKNLVSATELFGTEDALVSSLRSQLLVQTTLVEHLEGELAASQSLVASLSERYRKARETASHYKEEETKHKQNLSKLIKKCHELECMIEEANGERSQRSMLDECTADAMRVLQERCLEAEEKCKREIQNRKNMENELSQLQDCLDSFNATQHSLCLPDMAEAGEEIESLKAQIGKLQFAEEQRKVLEDELEMLRSENEQLQERVSRHTGKPTSPRGTRNSTANLHSVEVTNLREIIRQTSEELDELKRKYDEEITERNKEIETLRTEVETQWSDTESWQEKVEKLMATLEEKEGKLAALEQHNEQVERDYQALEVRCQEVEEDWQALEKQKQELLEGTAEAAEMRQQFENERRTLQLQARREKSEVERLTRAIQELQADLHQLDEERRFAVDDAERLKQNLMTREEEISSDSKKMSNLVLERDELANELARIRKENARLQEAGRRQQEDLAARECELQAERETLAKERAEENIARENVDSRISSLEEELRRAQKVIMEMKARSADKEVEIVQMQKARVKDRGDKEGLEIALQAKQQELDLIKRKLNVRGATEATSASRVLSRRESSSLNGTPMGPPPARPSSVLSIASSVGSTRKETLAGGGKTTSRNSLALSTRNTNTDSPDVATTSAVTATAKRARFVENIASPPSSAAVARRLSISSVSNLTSTTGVSSIKSPTSSSTPLPKTTSRTFLISRKSSAESTPPVTRKTSGDMNTTPRLSSTTTATSGGSKITKRLSAVLSPPKKEKENKVPSTISVRRRVAAMESS